MNLPQLLHQYQPRFSSVVPFDWQNTCVLAMDFTADNPDLAALDLTDTAIFTEYVFGKLRANGAVVGVGGYNENRAIYARSAHFDGQEEARTIHLGIDIWAEAGTPVFAPMAGQVHSFANNAHYGDYGPTIILAHHLEGLTFYTLYGHLNEACLEELYPGKAIAQGQPIAQIGPYPINGNWPPHLHFQLIEHMQGLKGDFPGVCAISEREKYLRNCPDPNLILGIPQLYQS